MYAYAPPDPWAMAADLLMPSAPPVVPPPAFANEQQREFFESHAPEILY